MYIKTDNLSKNNVFLQKWVFTGFLKNKERVLIVTYIASNNKNKE